MAVGLRREGARGEGVDGVGERTDVVGRRAAATAHDVDEAAPREVGHDAGERRGRLRVAAERVGQPGVGIAERRDVGRARERRDVRRHFGRAERAVEPDRGRTRVLDARPERLDGLARERAPRGVGDRGGGEHRRAVLDGNRVHRVGDREERGLQIQRVEAGLGEQEVGPPLEQPVHLFAVRGDERLKCDGAVRGVVDVGGERCRSVGRPDRPRDEADATWGFTLGPIGGTARDFRRLAVHLAHVRAEPVVGLRNRIRVEGVGLDDVRARVQVGEVDRLDRVGARQRQDIEVALQFVRMVAKARPPIVGVGERQALYLRAHRAVEDQDSLGEQRAEAAAALRRRAGGNDGHGAHAVPSPDVPAGGRPACGIARRSPARNRSAASTRPNGRLT